MCAKYMYMGCVWYVCLWGFVCVMCMHVWCVYMWDVYACVYVCIRGVYICVYVGYMCMCVCMPMWGVYVCTCGECVYVGCVCVCLCMYVCVRETERCEIYSVAGYSAIDRLPLHLQNLYLVKGYTDNNQVAI